MSSYLLCDLRDGESGTVSRISDNRAVLRRLSDIGFTEGARVKKLFSSPSGGISAYLVRDSVIAVRRRDAGGIFLNEP